MNTLMKSRGIGLIVSFHWWGEWLSSRSNATRHSLTGVSNTPDQVSSRSQSRIEPSPQPRAQIRWLSQKHMPMSKWIVRIDDWVIMNFKLTVLFTGLDVGHREHVTVIVRDGEYTGLLRWRWFVSSFFAAVSTSCSKIHISTCSGVVASRWNIWRWRWEWYRCWRLNEVVLQKIWNALKFVGGDESKPWTTAVFPGSDLANISTHEIHVSITFDEDINT